MSAINKIISNKKVLLTIKVILTILLLPIMTYLTKLFLMFTYNLGIYLGMFIRGLYRLIV